MALWTMYEMACFSFLAVLLALFALGNLAHYFLRADVFCSLDSCVWVLLVVQGGFLGHAQCLV